MAIPQTTVRTSHALTIRANGQTVGLINSWNPAQSRALTPIFELDPANSGNPIEYMPGNMSGLTLNVNRYDTYTKRMEGVFGTRDLIMLTRQSEPFDLYEVWKVPGPQEITIANAQVANANSISISPFTSEENYVYSGCWFTSLGRTLSSDDNRIVNVNATIVYTKKVKAQGIFGRALSELSQVSF